MWYHGTYGPCLADAYDGMFHHDWGKLKGQMFGRYPFGPIASGGCYAVDEWHPGGVEACAFYLTRVPLKVIVDQKLIAQFLIDQSTKGGRWNMLGQVELPFAS